MTHKRLNEHDAGTSPRGSHELSVDQSFKDLIEASSLGTPAARRIRSSTPSELVDDVRHRMEFRRKLYLKLAAAMRARQIARRRAVRALTIEQGLIGGTRSANSTSSYTENVACGLGKAAEDRKLGTTKHILSASASQADGLQAERAELRIHDRYREAHRIVPEVPGGEQTIAETASDQDKQPELIEAGTSSRPRRLPRLRLAPLLISGAGALLLLYLLADVTDVNPTSPVSAALVFALLAAMVIGVSFAFFRFTSSRARRCAAPSAAKQAAATAVVGQEAGRAAAERIAAARPELAAADLPSAHATGPADLRRHVQHQPVKTRRRRPPVYGSSSSALPGAGLALIAAVIAIIGALVAPHVTLRFWSPPGLPSAAVTLSAPSGNPAVLIVISDSSSPSTQAQLSGLVTATARPGERLVILSTSGRSLYSSSAPAPPTMIGPPPPPTIPAGATAYQQALYEKAIAEYQAKLKAAKKTLLHKQQQELATWAADAANTASVHSTRADFAEALTSAALDITSLDQAGLTDTGSKVVVILGSGQQLTTAPTTLPAGLKGTTVVVSGFLGNVDHEAAWQADMLEAGAANAMVLGSPDGGSQLASAVGMGLSGPPADMVLNISFDTGQSSFTKTAFVQLQHLLSLLVSKSPKATVTINGYADDLLAPEENLKLSQERAQAVSDWLVANGVTGNRLKIVAHGDSDPIPPSSIHREALNLGVAVIVEPIFGAFDRP